MKINLETYTQKLAYLAGQENLNINVLGSREENCEYNTTNQKNCLHRIWFVVLQTGQLALEEVSFRVHARRRQTSKYKTCLTFNGHRYMPLIIIYTKIVYVQNQDYLKHILQLSQTRYRRFV
jgi:hypothetical protein